MSDAGECGDIEGTFVVDDKVNIEETLVHLDCVKNEPNEEGLDSEEDDHATQYRITLNYENLFGKSTHYRIINEDYDNLIGFENNDVIMENAMIKLEAIKEDWSFNNFYCNKCKGIYKGCCLKCSTLLCILNNNLAYGESESDTIPTDILEIKETSRGKGVYLRRTLPVNVILGPFEGVLGVESKVGHSWKIIHNKLKDIKNGNWLKNIMCASSSSLKNLDIFQFKGHLYFNTNREIMEGEELLIYYDDKELQPLDNSEECLYTPQKQEKLMKIFACTVCCLGFSSNKCLMEHKRKSCWIEHCRNMKDFTFVECHYCKMWMEKWEHEEYHIANCLEKHYRMRSDNSEALKRSDTDVVKSEDDKRKYQPEICPKYDRPGDQQLDTKDYPCFSGASRKSRLAERLNNEQIQNTIEANNRSHLQRHLNKKKNIKSFQCNIYMVKFTSKDALKRHVKNMHIKNVKKDYKCSECSYQTNYKLNFQMHLNKHRGIKPFECDICMRKYSTKYFLAKHIKNKHGDSGSTKDYKCSECPYQTNYKGSLDTHLNMHRGIKPFECTICMKKFGYKSNIRKHIKNQHAGDGSAKDYKCSECSYQTNYKYHFKNHLNKHKGIQFQCDICKITYSIKSNLVAHIKNKHTGNVKQFQCDICKKAFSWKDSLIEHIQIVHGDNEGNKDYKCSDCSYQTNRKSNLRAHLKTHRSTKPFACDICKKEFIHRSGFKRHVKNKHVDAGSAKDYRCLECSYQTNYKNSLELHMNKHRGIKPFTCEICVMTFARKYSLRQHIRNIHTDGGGAKDYKCSECSYQTNRKSLLQRHLNEHTGIKLFTCEICLMTFARKYSLRQHIRNIHTDDGGAKDYKCSECSYQTNRKSALKRHLNVHTGIKPFQCDICMVKFTRKCHLTIHMKNKHADN